MLPYEAQLNTKDDLNRGMWHYRQALLRGWLNQTLRRGHKLHTLPARSASQQHFAGLRSVPIARIRGSEGRAHDFDGHFNPLTENTQFRWLSVYQAKLADRPLPPVELIQVADDFFVRDGHHRISVARSLGEEFIDAAVTAWVN